MTSPKCRRDPAIALTSDAKGSNSETGAHFVAECFSVECRARKKLKCVPSRLGGRMQNSNKTNPTFILSKFSHSTQTHNREVVRKSNFA